LNAAPDTITDFTTGTDVISLSTGALSNTSGITYDFSYKGAASNIGDIMGLLTGTAGTTTSRVGQYAMNTANSTLVLDLDGNGLIQGTDFALRLTNVAAIANGDIGITTSLGTTATGTDTVNLTTGGGADSITMDNWGGVASITAGAGDDLISSTATNLAATDSINGGLGIDTLAITSAGTVSLTTDNTLAGVERITLANGTNTFSLANQSEGFTVTGGTGADAITLGSAASSVTAGAGDDSITVASYAILALDTIAGGAATTVDNLTISTADLTIVDAGFANVTGIEQLTLTGTSTAVLGANAAAAGIATVVTGATATSITSTQTSLAVTDSIGTAGVALTLLGSANYTVSGTGNATANTVTATGSTGTLAITLADITANTAAVATGSGNVTITGTGTTDTVTVTGLATANQVFVGNAGTSVNFNVTGTTGAQSITTGAGADVVNGGAGADTISTGAGNDSITVASTTEANGDVIDGGAGTDTIVTSAAVDFTSTSLTGVEQYTIFGGATATFLGTQLSGAAIAFNESDNGTTGIAINVAGGTSADFSALTFTAFGGGNAFDAGADTVTITTGATSTTVVGTSVADSITGGIGDDVITGGGGADTMTGGAGNDTFVFTSTADILTTTAFNDTIAGGAGTADAIRLTTQTGVTIPNNLVFTPVTGIERITAGISAAAISITLDVATNTNFTASGITTIDLSGDTSATGTNVVSLTGALGVSSVVGSAGVDQFTLGTAATVATITGGAGLDTYAIATSGNTLAFTAVGDTPVGVVTNGAGDLRTLGDVVTLTGGAAAGFTLRLDLSTLNIAALNSITTIAVGNAAGNLLSGTSGVLAITQGVIVNGVFTAGNAGTDQDLLVQWDTNGATAGGVESILIDNSATTAADTAAALVGVITITIA